MDVNRIAKKGRDAADWLPDSREGCLILPVICGAAESRPAEMSCP